MVRAVLLAAGYGTRLLPYTEILEKALLPIGSKPAIKWVTDSMGEQGIDVFVICSLSKFRPQFEHEYRDANSKVLFHSVEQPLGTAGHVRQCFRDGLIRSDEPFILYYADDLTKVDYHDLLKVHASSGYDATVVVTDNIRHDYSKVYMSDKEKGKVTGFEEKPYIGHNAWAGIAVVEPHVVGDLGDYDTDFGHNVWPRLAQQGRLGAYYNAHAWLDIGNTRAYYYANKLAKEGKLLT